MTPRALVIALGLLGVAGNLSGAVPAAGGLEFDTPPGARCELRGPVGERVRRNIEHWLLRAPGANPGMLEMFRFRDRRPPPQLVPWAGEFVGKYLISAVQALRMSDDPRLRRQVAEIVGEFMASQAEDGYLGPFPKGERLLKHWDLWGHYHAIRALLMWHEHSGDAAALACARKAADLVCATYLGTGRRVLDAGDPEMNMSILTGLVQLHRMTGEPRYMEMAREVEKDWERAGDYVRAGLDGREFYQSPRPRWESLHDLQGLVELWRATGEPKYRAAFAHHWRSLRRWDIRNTGGFSSGEQATGNPYAPSAIETCCTVAWMAVTLDYLRLTGDAGAADALELATLNGGLGAQHPSGRWWTYNTPMDGTREASAHSIVFQARAGTPELNCCSVNGPRILGILSEWAVLTAPDGWVVNWLGAGRFTHRRQGQARTTISLSHDAWLQGRTELRVDSSTTAPRTLRVRIPAWAVEPRADLNGAPVPHVVPGAYLGVRRVWRADDRLALRFELPVRFTPGANEAAGKVSLYRGPILLAFDPAHNAFDEDDLPPVDLERLAQAQEVTWPEPPTQRDALLQPWLAVDVPTADGRTVRLVDFAGAGARGTPYRSWLIPARPRPAPALTQCPPDGARVSPGPALFRWRSRRDTNRTGFRVEVAATASFRNAVPWTTNVGGTRHVLDTSGFLRAGLGSGAPTVPRPFWWRVVALGPSGETAADVPPAQFTLGPGMPPARIGQESSPGPNGEIVIHSLRGGSPPQFGQVKSAAFLKCDGEGTEVDGRGQMLVYHVPEWPEDEFTAAVRVRVSALPEGRLGQVLSAWHAAMDDPLRLVIEGGKLFARVEAGAVHSTAGVPIQTGRWYAVAVVKQGGSLVLWVDGKPVGRCTVPEYSSTRAADCALGGNPHHTGNEFLAARFADFKFCARALPVAAAPEPKPQ
ncbi:MAG: glycoside hydrolase family 127 protein [Verrucomicrobia bacterium]|nr:glycoside hydrolase family 127 protein [Verrucomicrobiota bacterium]